MTYSLACEVERVSLTGREMALRRSDGAWDRGSTMADIVAQCQIFPKKVSRKWDWTTMEFQGDRENNDWTQPASAWRSLLEPFLDAQWEEWKIFPMSAWNFYPVFLISMFVNKMQMQQFIPIFPARSSCEVWGEKALLNSGFTFQIRKTPESNRRCSLMIVAMDLISR